VNVGVQRGNTTDLRLDQGVIRELHWHTEAEWAYVLAGKVRVTALDLEGRLVGSSRIVVCRVHPPSYTQMFRLMMYIPY
jgi:oxalate decarboxylase/phosphoglucose isomerase-like protein (cupin superfamily)